MPQRQNLGRTKVLEKHLTIYRNDPDNPPWIADKVFPPMMVSSRKGEYAKLTGKGFGVATTINEMKRASGAPYERLTFDFSWTDAYTLYDLGIEAMVEDLDEAFAAEDGLDARKTAAELAADWVYIQRERIAQALLMTAGNWGSNTSAVASGDRWDAGANADPRVSIDTAADAIRLGTGVSRKQLTLVCGHDEYRALSRNLLLRNVMQYTNGGEGIELTKPLLVGVLGIKDIIVGGGIANTAAEPLAETRSDIWGGDNQAFLGHIVSNPNPRKPHGYGGTFRWKGIAPGGRVRRYREDNPPGEVVQVNYVEQPSITETACGYLLTTVTS